MIKTFSTYDFDTQALDKEVNAYLKKLEAEEIEYTIQTSSAASQHNIYRTVTVISKK